MGISYLNNARNSKKDEFYTEYGVIETLYMDWRYMFEQHLCVGQY